MSSPFDTCVCGDYRRDHSGPDGRGACRLNGLGHGVPGYACERFSLQVAEANLSPEETAHVAHVREITNPSRGQSNDR